MQVARVAFISVALLALVPSAGSAQDHRPLHVSFGGAYVWNASDLGDHFANGWGPAISLAIEVPNRRFGFQFEYAYSFFDIKDSAPFFEATRFGANHQMNQLDFNIFANLLPSGGRMRPYVVAGPGLYYRLVEITDYVGSGVICDPFYYLCGTYPVEEVLGSRGGWDWGFNVGGGVGLALNENAEFYIEMRYHFVNGPEVPAGISTPTGVTTGDASANGSYFPLMFGLRF